MLHQSPEDYQYESYYQLFGGNRVKAYPENPVNPACPARPVESEGYSSGVALADGTGVRNISLAEVTIEDVLLHFGDTLKVACRRYRQFVKNGIDQGKRPEFQGGGLVRSAGGNKAGLSGRKKEERELSDQRILGSGDFVMNVIKKANELLDERAGFNLTLDELVSRVCSRFGIMFDELVSKNRRRRLSQARAAVSYLAVDKLGYTGEDVARLLKVSGRSVSNCRERGKILFDNKETISEYLL